MEAWWGSNAPKATLPISEVEEAGAVLCELSDSSLLRLGLVVWGLDPGVLRDTWETIPKIESNPPLGGKLKVCASADGTIGCIGLGFCNRVKVSVDAQSMPGEGNSNEFSGKADRGIGGFCLRCNLQYGRPPYPSCRSDAV